jgi:hypothetical protein
MIIMEVAMGLKHIVDTYSEYKSRPGLKSPGALSDGMKRMAENSKRGCEH